MLVCASSLMAGEQIGSELAHRCPGNFPREALRSANRITRQMPAVTRHERMVSLLTSHQARLITFVRSLVPTRADADEIVQEVNLYLWRHFDELRSDESFSAWAFQTAKYQVLTYRKRLGRERSRFSDTLVEQLADPAMKLAESVDRRESVLLQCIDRLPDKDREVVLLRYESDCSTQQIADRTERSVKAVYECLRRTRNRLLECIRRSLAAEDHSK